MLEHKEYIDERHLHAQHFFMAMKTCDTLDDEIEFTTILLYLVASLITKSSHFPSENDEYIFVKRDPGEIEALMSHLIRENEPDSGRRLLDSFDYNLVEKLMTHTEPLEPRITKRKGFALIVFDLIFERLLAAHGISLDHSRIVSAFANSLIKDWSSVVDAFPYSGEIGIAAREIGTKRDIYFWDIFGYPFSFQGIVSLRIKLHKINWEAYRFSQLDGDPQKNLTLIDRSENLVGYKKSHSSIAVLQELMEMDEMTDLTLVVLDRDQCKDIPQRILNKIESGDLLEAVVDFCSIDHNGNQLPLTAWILNKSKEQERETLFIDVEPLIDSGSIRAIWFASAVIERWRSSRFRFKSKQHFRHFDDRLKNLFSNYLEENFRELPGFIATLSSSSAINKNKLTANSVITKHTSSADLFKLENADLVERIIDSELPTCTYIIGDNGAGKSLLLCNLIAVLDKGGIDSVGIAFSAIDRFPNEPPPNSLFTYQGVKETRCSTAEHPHSTLAQLLIGIFADSYRLASFKKLLKVLNFNHRLFLIPIAIPDHSASDWEVMLATVSLDENYSSIETNSKFEPGVQHQENGPIIRFSSLSSGEQQLLSLLIKICAHADHYTTFLIDEPEISMHVRWQQQIPQLLASISDEHECSFVVATHSPLVIANARAKDTCYLASNKILTQIPPYKRHSVESILLDGFNTYTPDSREINDRCAVLVSRAIQARNQPGDTDPHLKSKLLESLKNLSASLKSSTSDKKNASYAKDLNLVKQARKAVTEILSGVNARETIREQK